MEILVKRENQGSGQSTECITETQVSNQQRMIRTWTTKVSASTLLKKKGVCVPFGVVKVPWVPPDSGTRHDKWSIPDAWLVIKIDPVGENRRL